MKKLVLILSCFVFLSCASSVRGRGFFEELREIIDLKEDKEDADIFSDPAFTQPSNNFSAGQMIYLKIESPVNGDREKSLRILDSEKRETYRLSLNQSGNIFTASFVAPSVPGVYYIDIKIEDAGGSKFASQENINVGEGSGQVEVSAEAESVVVQGSLMPPTFEPVASPQPTVEADQPVNLKPSEETPPSFMAQIIEFFSKFIAKLISLTTLDRIF